MKKTIVEIEGKKYEKVLHMDADCIGCSFKIGENDCKYAKNTKIAQCWDKKSRYYNFVELPENE